MKNDSKKSIEGVFLFLLLFLFFVWLVLFRRFSDDVFSYFLCFFFFFEIASECRTILPLHFHLALWVDLQPGFINGLPNGVHSSIAQKVAWRQTRRQAPCSSPFDLDAASVIPARRFHTLQSSLTWWRQGSLKLLSSSIASKNKKNKQEESTTSVRQQTKSSPAAGCHVLSLPFVGFSSHA